MTDTDASKLCESHGATLLIYKPPRMASVVLRSREEIMISIGPTHAKIFKPSRLFGWLIPRCCASKPLAEWHSSYTQFNSLHRNICRGMVLDGLVDLVTSADSVAELCLAWCSIRNPLEITSLALFKQTFPDAKQS
jgi:hypothetical protein